MKHSRAGRLLCVCVGWQVLTPYGASRYLSGTWAQCTLSGQQAFKGLGRAVSIPTSVSIALTVSSQLFETLRAPSISLARQDAIRRNFKNGSVPRYCTLRASSGSHLAPPNLNGSFLHEELGLGQAQKPELGKYADTDLS